jgi:hypothetical protein
VSGPCDCGECEDCLRGQLEKLRADRAMLVSEMSRGFRLLNDACELLMTCGRRPTAEWRDRVLAFDDERQRSRAIAAERWGWVARLDAPTMKTGGGG